MFVFTFFGFLFFQFLLLVLDGFHLCVVDLSQLVPVRSVVVQAIKHGLDLFVEPGELLMNDGQNTGTSARVVYVEMYCADDFVKTKSWGHSHIILDVCV